MKKRLVFSTIVLMLFSVVTMAQKSAGWECSTKSPEKDYLRDVLKIEGYSRASISTKFVNVHFHIIRRTNQTGGLSTAEVNSVLSIIRNDFSDWQICFAESGRSYINNDYYYNAFSETKFWQLITVNPHSTAIDIYLLPEGANFGGKAAGIPGTAMVVEGSLSQTSVVSHEVGHCLGLYHTHSGRGCGDNDNCEENINGSNCSTCGDLVCDTPADPCLVGLVNGDCEYTGGGGFDPDVPNIMSYTPPTCMEHFTSGQNDRIHTMIANSSALQNTLVNSTISGDFLVCTSNKTYTLNNRPSGTTVTWTNSQNLNYVSGQGTDNYTVKAASSSSGGLGWVRATISNCDDFYVEKEVQSGPFCSCNIYVIGIPGVCPGNNYVYTANVPGGHQAGFSYHWTKPNNWSINYQSGNTISLYVPLYNPDYGTVRASVWNGCGSYSGYSGITVYPGYGCGGYYSIFPNPTNTEIEISAKIIEKQGETEKVTVLLFDQSNMLVLENEIPKNGGVIDVSKLRKGGYIMHVIDRNNKNIFKTHILIE